jgi:hypothetical protein
LFIVVDDAQRIRGGLDDDVVALAGDAVEIETRAANGGSRNRERIDSNAHRCALWWSMIFSENRNPLFRIML